MTHEIQFTDKLLDYKDYLQYSNQFWETGSAAGDGIQRALDAGFEFVVSVEAQKEWFEMCKQRFDSNRKVTLVFGKSVDQMNTEIFRKWTEKPFVFFLDAHVSGEASAGYEEWKEKAHEAESAQDKIIKAELKIILSNYNKHVIIIDDVNGLADGHAKEYMRIMLKANPDYKFSFYDENLSGTMLYKDKILVAIP